MRSETIRLNVYDTSHVSLQGDKSFSRYKALVGQKNILGLHIHLIHQLLSLFGRYNVGFVFRLFRVSITPPTPVSLGAFTNEN